MKKYLIVMLLSLLGASGGYSQSFKDLWEKEAEARKDNLPKTEWKYLKIIESKALRENAQEQLLGAWYCMARRQDMFAKETPRIDIRKMIAHADSIPDRALQALWRNALSRLLMTASASPVYYEEGYSDRRSKQKDYEQRAKALYLKSFESMSVLAKNKVSKYPFLIHSAEKKGADATLLRFLLLNQTAPVYLRPEEEERLLERAREICERLGLRSDALLCELEGIKQRFADGKADAKVSLAALKALAEKNGENPAVSKVYAEMAELLSLNNIGRGEEEELMKLLVAFANRPSKNAEDKAFVKHFLEVKSAPSFSLEMREQQWYPGKTEIADLRYRNIGEIKLEIRKLRGTAADFNDYALSEEDFPTLFKQGKTACRNVYVCKKGVVYQNHEDTLRLRLDEPGVYLARTSVKGFSDKYGFVFVSRVKPLLFSKSGGKRRVICVDALSGLPFEDAGVTSYKMQGRTMTENGTYVSAANGDIWFYSPNEESNVYYASAGKDAYSLPFSDLRSYNAAVPFSAVRDMSRLFLDRSVYRPGQMLHFAGLLYHADGDETGVTAGVKAAIQLYDAGGRKIAEKTLSADEWGMVSGSFSLPKTGATGYFRLCMTTPGTTSNETFRVEEYKRPLFEVKLDPDYRKINKGALRLRGTARTYSGMPVGDAEVNYVASRYWSEQEVSGSARTDENGAFSIAIPIDTLNDDFARRWIGYSVTVSVTERGGETESASTSFFEPRRRGVVSIDCEANVCKEYLPKWTAEVRTKENLNVSSVVKVFVYQHKKLLQEDAFMSPKSYIPKKLLALPSGTYSLVFKAAGCDSAVKKVYLFSVKDTSLKKTTPFWKYAHYDKVRNTADLFVGTSEKDAMFFYDELGGSKTVVSRRVRISNGICHFHLAYRPEQGDNVRAFVAMLRDGKLHTAEASVSKPVPDKRLQLEWETFRSDLLPGASETWTLKVKNSAGKAASASVLASMHDASLDQFGENLWSFALSFPRLRTPGSWTTNYNPSVCRSDCERVKAFEHPAPVLSWNPLFQMRANRFYHGLQVPLLTSAMPRRAMELRNGAQLSDEEPLMDTKGWSGGAGKKKHLSPIRANFAETAFFYPQLRTDEQGKVSLVFTLPQSITTWRFQAFAHDKDMNFGLADTTAVARKSVMIQPFVPRFLREGDSLLLTAVARNMGEGGLSGKVVFDCLDADGKRVLESKEFAFEHLTGERTFSVPLKCKENSGGAILMRWRVITPKGSDGEEHLAPVLSDRVAMLNSVPLWMNDSLPVSVNVDSLWKAKDHRSIKDKALTVELTGQPLWYAVGALPGLSHVQPMSSLDYAQKYYALSMAEYIARHFPSIASAIKDKKEAEAWTNELERNEDLKHASLSQSVWAGKEGEEKSRALALAELFDLSGMAEKKAEILHQLSRFQRPDGSYAWFHGMNGNFQTTVQIATLLARLQFMCHDRGGEIYLRKSMDFLEKEMNRYVSDEKNNQAKAVALSLSGVQYLYIKGKLKEPLSRQMRKLLSLLSSVHYTSVYSNALLADVFEMFGYKREAGKLVRSLEEHLETGKAGSLGFAPGVLRQASTAQRLAAQTILIEMLANRNESEKDKTQALMRWLLMEKRTTEWQTPEETADAVYALLLLSEKNLLKGSEERGGLDYYLIKNGQLIDGSFQKERTSSVLNYMCHTYKKPAYVSADKIVIVPKGKSMSWGAVYAKYSVPAMEAVASDNDISLARKWEVWRENHWKEIKGECLKTGDRVRQVCVVHADRNFDFVSLKMTRPVCMEPVNRFSGYDFQEDDAYYRVVRDASDEYFIEHLTQGDHSFVEENHVVRSGVFNTGIAQIQSLYAPEFSASSAAILLNIK